MTLAGGHEQHLADIVEVSMRRSLLGQELFVGIEHDMQVELLLQQHEAVVAEALDGAHGSDLAHPVGVKQDPDADSLRTAASLPTLQLQQQLQPGHIGIHSVAGCVTADIAACTCVDASVYTFTVSSVKPAVPKEYLCAKPALCKDKLGTCSCQRRNQRSCLGLGRAERYVQHHHIPGTPHPASQSQRERRAGASS